MKKFKINLHFLEAAIYEVEIERETDQKIFFKNKRFELKRSRFHAYFDTWDEAFQELKVFVGEKLDRLKKEVSRYQSILDDAENIKEGK